MNTASWHLLPDHCDVRRVGTLCMNPRFPDRPEGKHQRNQQRTRDGYPGKPGKPSYLFSVKIQRGKFKPVSGDTTTDTSTVAGLQAMIYIVLGGLLHSLCF